MKSLKSTTNTLNEFIDFIDSFVAIKADDHYLDIISIEIIIIKQKSQITNLLLKFIDFWHMDAKN
jgi:hypothetical protein